MRLPPARRHAKVYALACTLGAGALAAATPARAQFAGVPPAPPRRAAAPAVAARPTPDSASRLRRARDSAQVAQRLDIQAWVDSAAPALAAQPPATPDSARGRPPAPPSPTRPAPARRPLAAHGALRPAARVAARAVAARDFGWYLRPWPSPAPPSRSV